MSASSPISEFITDFILEKNGLRLHIGLAAEPSPQAWTFVKERAIWSSILPDLDIGSLAFSIRPPSKRASIRRAIHGEVLSQQKQRLRGCSVSGGGKFTLHKQTRSARYGFCGAGSPAITRFLAGIRPAARNMAARFSNGQWEVLSALAHDASAIELGENNPALLYMIATADRQCLPANAMNYPIFSRRQREICGMLGLPSTESMRKILAKIGPESCAPGLLPALLRAVSEESSRKILLHLPKITMLAVLILSRPQITRWVNQNFFEQLIAADSLNGCRDAYAGILALDRFPESTAEMLRPQSGDLEDFIRLGQYTKVLLSSGSAQENGGHSLPSLPFLPPQGSQFLSTPELVQEEGKIQRNCLYDLLPEARRGSKFLFRMYFPERATFSVLRHAGGVPSLDEAKLADNKSVSSRTVRFLQSWLDYQPPEKMPVKIYRPRVELAVPQTTEPAQMTFDFHRER